MLNLHRHFKQSCVDSSFSANVSRPIKAPLAKQYFVRVVFTLDEDSHSRISRFLSHGAIDNLYDSQDPNCSLRVPVAVLDGAGQKATAEKIAAFCTENLNFKNDLAPQEIMRFVPVSDMYPDVAAGAGFIAAVFKEDAFFRSHNEHVINLIQKSPPALCASFWPEFAPHNYHPFMTVGRVNNTKKEQVKIAQALTNHLQLNPQVVAVKSFSFEVSCFDFEKYFAKVDLEHTSNLKKNISAFEHFLKWSE